MESRETTDILLDVFKNVNVGVHLDDYDKILFKVGPRTDIAKLKILIPSDVKRKHV